MQIPKDDIANVEQGVNDVAEIAFDAGYMRALKDVLDKTNHKVTSEIAKMMIEHLNVQRAKEFVKDHPFKFITK